MVFSPVSGKIALQSRKELWTCDRLLQGPMEVRMCIKTGTCHAHPSVTITPSQFGARALDRFQSLLIEEATMDQPRSGKRVDRHPR